MVKDFRIRHFVCFICHKRETTYHQHRNERPEGWKYYSFFGKNIHIPGLSGVELCPVCYDICKKAEDTGVSIL